MNLSYGSLTTGYELAATILGYVPFRIRSACRWQSFVEPPEESISFDSAESQLSGKLHKDDLILTEASAVLTTTATPSWVNNRGRLGGFSWGGLIRDSISHFADTIVDTT